MKLKKSWKLFSLIAASTIAVSAAIPLATTLSSCSGQEKQYTPFSYDKENQTLNVNSFSLFGSNNILYGFQLIKMGNYPDKGIKNYNLKDALNKALEPTFGPNFISEAQNVTQTSVSADGYKLIIPVTDTSSIRSEVIEVNNPLKKIIIEFPKLDKNDLNSIPSIYSSSRISFPSKTMQEVMQLDPEDIIAGVGINLIPKNALFAKSKPRIEGDNLQYFVFIPNVGLLLLNIDFSKIQVPSVIPSNNIASSNLQNNWENIINWSPAIPQQITYKVIDNPTGLTSANGKMFISSYEKALNSQTLLDQFNSIYYNQPTTSKQVDSSEINKETLITDFNYFVKNFIADVIKDWKGQNILNSNIYTGVNVVVNDNKFDGSVGIQFQNTSGKNQVIELNYLSKPISVNKGDTVSIVFEFNDSQIAPSLKENPKNKYQAYLLPKFNNVSINVSVNNQIVEVSKSNDYIRIFDYSLELQTLVSNVLEANNYLSEANKIEKVYEQEFGKQKAPNEEFYLNAIRQDVKNKINSTSQVILGIQNIALKWAENPTILDFLQSLSLELNRIITAIGGSSQIADVVSTIFSEQPLASFLYFNLQNIVNLIRSFATPTNAETINGIANMIEQIVIGNPSLQAMEEWLSTFQSAYASLEHMLKDDKDLGPLLPLMKHLLDTISSNPSIVHLVFMNLNAIFVVGQNYNDKTIQAVVKSLQEYMNGLLAFVNEQVTSSKQVRANSSIENDPNDLTKYNNIKVFDVFMYPNDYSSYKSLFTILANNWPKKANDEQESIAKTFQTIGKVLEAIKFSGINPESLKNAINKLFNGVQVAKNNTQYETTNLFSVFSNIIQVEEEINDNSYEYKISFSKDVKINFEPITSLISSIKLPTVNIPKIGDIPLNFVISLGNLFLPNTLYINTKNYLILSYSKNNNNLSPIVENDELYWELNAKCNKQLVLDEKFIEPISVISNGAKASKWGSLLLGGKITVIDSFWKKIFEAIPNLPEFAKPLLQRINISRWIALFIQNIYTNTKTTNVNLLTKSKTSEKIVDFNNKEAMDNVECVINNTSTSTGGQDFNTWLTSQLQSNVKWDTQKSKNGFDITTPTLQWTPSEEFNTQLASYLQLGQAFTDNPQLVNYSTALSGFKVTIIDKVYTIYDFTINFSVPTLVKDLQGNYSVRDSISFKVTFNEPLSSQKSSRN